MTDDEASPAESSTDEQNREASTDEENGDSSTDENETQVAENGLLVSERSTDEGLLVAACDADILGETFEDDRVSLTVTEEFYGGEPADVETVMASLRRAQTANIVGEHVVEAAIEADIIDPETVLHVEGTPHAQLVAL